MQVMSGYTISRLFVGYTFIYIFESATSGTDMYIW